MNADITEIINIIIALILALIAYYNKQRTDMAKTCAPVATVASPLPVGPVVATSGPSAFLLTRDGSRLMEGNDGWYARINPSPEAATIPDDKAWQAVSPNGKFYSGDKDNVIYLLTSDSAAGWRKRYA